MRSVDADRGVLLTDPALIAANRARLAELKTLPLGGVNSLADFPLSDFVVWKVVELAAASVLTIVISTLARSGALPIAFEGVCGCVMINALLLIVAAGLGLGHGCVQLVRWLIVRSSPGPLVRRVDLHA